MKLAARQPTPNSRVYFMREPGVSGPVKIGCSTLPTVRLAQLMLWSPVDLVIVAELPGSYELEWKFHAQFAPDWIRNEWFRSSAPLDATIEAIRAGSFDIASLPSPRRLMPQYKSTLSVVEGGQ